MSAAAETDHYTVNLTRELAAPRELVFEAWSSSAHLEKWFAPDGFTCTYPVDFRPGGAFSLTMTGFGMTHTVRGVYREIVRPERIVQTMMFDDMPGVEVLTTVTFVAQGAKTLLTVTQRFPPLAQLSAAHRTLLEPRLRGAPIGWGQTLQHLADHVERR